MVGRWAGGRLAGVSSRPGQALFDPRRDRLVLVTSLAASASVRVHLAQVLDRVRGLTSGRTLASAATNDAQRRGLDVIVNHVERVWRALTGDAPSREQLTE